MASTTVINRQTTASEDWTHWIRNTPLGQELRASLLAFSQTLPRAVEELNEGVAEGFQMVSELIANQTARIATLESRIDTLKSRQAVSGAFQAVSLAILILWLIALATRAIWVCVTKKQQAKQEDLVEMMERSLNERRSKRKAAARPSPADK